MLRVGITGGIGSGKTALTDWLAAQGIVIVDADLAARVVVEPGKQMDSSTALRCANSFSATKPNARRSKPSHTLESVRK